MLGMVSVYCTYVNIAKNWHLKFCFASGTVSKNRHLPAEIKLRTSTKDQLQALTIDRCCAYPRIAFDAQKKWLDQQWYTLPVGERWVNPLPDEASRTKWEKSKAEAVTFVQVMLFQ